jgi:glycosyltransferase involved in cell wall biosynthesis
LPGIDSILSTRLIKNKEDIAKIRDAFGPDLVIFRNWSGTEHLMEERDVFWAQEISPKDEKEDFSYPVFDFPTQAKYILDCSKVSSKNNNRIWLPYCSPKCYVKSDKDIPVMVATNIPAGKCGEMKQRSVSILLKRFSESNPGSVHAFEGFYGGLSNISHLHPCIKPSFNYFDSSSVISRAKIYVSPTSIWYDEGYVSQKTIEAMSYGTFVLTNNYVGMEDIFGKDGETLVYADTEEEAFDKIQYYLAHDKEREEIATRGQEFIRTERSWGDHLNRVLAEIGESRGR